MAGKQSKYLADLLGEEEEAPSPPPVVDERPARARGMTLLGREAALARVASGEVRQVTQHLLDPKRVRVWTGNARSYAHLTEENVRDLIDSIIAEGGQKVPAVVRRISGDPDHEFEVIAGTRRHFAISWLRANSWPEMMFLAQVADLDDEAAFRLADIENRARKDVSDLERAKNYAAALHAHYGGHQTRMAERLRLSKGWLSKMLKVASIPDDIIAAFASPADVQLKPAYELSQALEDPVSAKAIRKQAKTIAAEQAARRERGTPPLPFAEVLSQLLSAPAGPESGKASPWSVQSSFGRPMLSLQSTNRQGVTVRLHAGSGASNDELLDAVRALLTHLEDNAIVRLK